jgi:hypothetical protein
VDADLPSTDRAIRSVTSPFTQSHRGQALFSTQGKEGNIQSLVPRCTAMKTHWLWALKCIRADHR